MSFIIQKTASLRNLLAFALFVGVTYMLLDIFRMTLKIASKVWLANKLIACHNQRWP